MKKQIIFDLSEVLICGLKGLKHVLAKDLDLPVQDFWGGDPLFQICMGEISEEEYLDGIIEKFGLEIGKDRLKEMCRKNFQIEMEGAVSILLELSENYDIFLHSDHGREWVEYIESFHPFMKIFRRTFFSYDLGCIKSDPKAFEIVLDSLKISGESCIFIDDNPQNVENAKTLGMEGIHFLGARQLKNELRARLLIDKI